MLFRVGEDQSQLLKSLSTWRLYSNHKFIKHSWSKQKKYYKRKNKNEYISYPGTHLVGNFHRYRLFILPPYPRNKQRMSLVGDYFRQESYLKKVLVGQTEWFNQVPSETGLRIKIAEHLEGSTVVINNCIQSRRVEPSCFVVLTTFSQLNLAVCSNKRCQAGTVVPNARGLTYLSAGSSIETRIVPAAVIGTRDVTNTWDDVATSLVNKICLINYYWLILIKVPYCMYILRKKLLRNESFIALDNLLYFVSFIFHLSWTHVTMAVVVFIP